MHTRLLFRIQSLHYKYDDLGFATNYIESISIKEKQVIYVAGFPEGSQVEILAIDNQSDIALIGKKISELKKEFSFHLLTIL
ncbi:MAG: hypothetical protein MZV64_53460 [Ignavibacteriales bacterium]|nr:hypothetical protein [Ignavibacteriales bacterium]